MSAQDWSDMCGSHKPQPPKQDDSEPINNAGLEYQAHVQDIGWCP
jgi:hypothetical protein